MLWSLPWETPSGGSLHSGAQTGVAPGVTVDHACLHQSRFDSERSHERKSEDEEEAQTQDLRHTSWARSSAVEHPTFNRSVESSTLSGLTKDDHALIQ